MANSAQILKLQGWNVFVNKLKQVPDRIKKQEINKVQRSILRPVKNRAQAIAQEGKGGKNPGSLGRAIGFYTLKGRDIAGVTLGVQRRLKYKHRAFHWHLFAKGTAQRFIDSYKTRDSTRARFVQGADGRQGIQVTIGGRALVITKTGQMPAKPYMEIAYKANRGPLSTRHAKSLNKILVKELKKK